MDAKEVIKLLARIGITAQVTPTGSDDYQRIFIRKDKCTYGRICIHKGVYSHVKWYCPRADGELNENDFLIYSWAYLLKTGQVLTQAVWSGAVAIAEQERLQDKARREQWRLANPQTC